MLKACVCIEVMYEVRGGAINVECMYITMDKHFLFVCSTSIVVPHNPFPLNFFYVVFSFADAESILVQSELMIVG